MSFRNISAWCIRNPVPPIVLFIALLLTGIYAFATMEVTDNPDIDFPAATVTISQPGAAPSELVNQVTQKVEAAVRGVEGIDEINSDVREGSSNTFVQFKIGTPTDRAVNDVRDAIAQIRGDLPEGILEPQINRVQVNGDSFVYIAAQTTDMSLADLSWYIDGKVSRRLLSQDGVAQVTREGGVDRQIRIVLDPASLQAQGITAAQVNAQLRTLNLNAAGGRAQIAGSEQTVRVLGNSLTAQELAQKQIALPGGRFIRLADIAQVQDAAAEARSSAQFGGRPVVSFNVARAKGASDVTAYDNTWKELHKIEKEDPRVRFVEIDNSVDRTKLQYSSAVDGLVEGAVLAVLVVFLFLRDIRATLISALAIPLSAIPAFWFMDLMSINLNGLSLLALSLVAGVLVDDAIVEIENIVRHMRMGKSAYQASIDAADEIGLAVLATTMSIVAVFLPVALMPGISGQFFRNFGYTVVLAVLMSLLVARMITPLIAAYFLKSHGVQEHAGGKSMMRYLGALRWTIDSSKVAPAQARSRSWIGRRLARFRDHRIWMVGVGFLILASTGVGIATLSMAFQPDQDSESSSVRIQMPPGTTLDQTMRVAEQAATVIKRNPNVQDVFMRSFTGSAFVNVLYKKDRTKKSFEIEREINPQLAQIPDARVNFNSNDGGPGSGGRALSLYLGGDDPQQLTRVANQIAAEMATLPEVVAPRVQGDNVRPELIIKPRFDLAADLGVSTSALAQTIRIATIGDIDQNSARFSLSDRQVPIIVSLAQSERKDISTLENLPVPTASGGSVPLKSVAEISFSSGPVIINRTNQVQRIVVGADLAPGLVSGDAWKKIDQLPTLKNLPEGVQRLSLGSQKWQAELIMNFILAVLAGIALVFAVLVLLYRRFLVPFVNLGSLLLAPLGAVIALHIAGQPLSLPVFIGLLMLLGIVAKNSILLVDFAVEMMNHGMHKDEAIVEAGHKRAQPIVMTTVAMVAGMIPIALSLSGDGSWRAPMGVTVIGGLIMSTGLTLLLVPAYFSLAIDIEQWIGAKFGKGLRATAHAVHEEVPEQRAPGFGGSQPQPAE
ncbi:efflux RND transporter permease subunit [Sphingomonas sp. BN140010]|uniref:Efflux RND transporter permease subunit n=1 Tax=Sphingomonas arvum TaxID=2992113 RepID=A0ABT3JHA8_9SPHN|nr:efflux RND transporter permease subunit [Sphingomonas sp. BN140010]MCW3798161.1 efflux RND transporter permease subunit [Sphingomonas sp. BN140010]